MQTFRDQLCLQEDTQDQAWTRDQHVPAVREVSDLKKIPRLKNHKRDQILKSGRVPPTGRTGSDHQYGFQKSWSENTGTCWSSEPRSENTKNKLGTDLTQTCRTTDQF